MIVACINMFNEIQFIEQCLRSIKDKVDKIIVVDGTYKEFPHKECYSTDGSLEIAKRYADNVIECKEPWENQIAKRNQYLHIYKGVDVYHLVIDADEELIGSLKGYEQASDWNIKLLRTDGIGEYNVYRIFKWREDLHYEGAHHCLVTEDYILNKFQIPVLENCKLIHFNSERDKKRIEDKGTYYRERIDEIEFRRINNM